MTTLKSFDPVSKGTQVTYAYLEEITVRDHEEIEAPDLSILEVYGIEWETSTEYVQLWGNPDMEEEIVVAESAPFEFLICYDEDGEPHKTMFDDLSEFEKNTICEILVNKFNETD